MVSDFFAIGLGWLYLKVRYRTTASMQLALNEKYNGSYGAAAGIVAMKFFAVLFMIMIALLVLALVVVSLFKFGIQ